MSTENAVPRLLLLSGGIDSAAIAAWLRPQVTLFIDYGQRPVHAEAAASKAVALELGLHHAQIRVDASAVGSGLLASNALTSPRPGPSPEWWPFRNQLLVTLAAGWLLSRHLEPPATEDAGGWLITMGTVCSDGARHADGTPAFLSALDHLLSLQEGGIRVDAPAAGMTTAELLRASSAADAVLGWTHSCHVANVPCGQCPGCYKREAVLTETGRLM